MQTRCYQADFVCVTVRNESSVTGNPFPGIQPIGSSPPSHVPMLYDLPGRGTHVKTCSQAARFDLNGREMDRKRQRERERVARSAKLRGELGWLRLRKERGGQRGGFRFFCPLSSIRFLELILLVELG